MFEPDCWYVSYSVKLDRRSQRITRKFITEDDARLFVREIAGSTLRLTAGTINPHSPKRIIASTEIERWLETST
jgi:hypothetical protein